MSDTLVIGGTTYNGVAGFKAKDSSNNTKTYIRPSGSLPISSNNTYDVTQYASAVVNVSGGGSGSNGTYTPTSDVTSADFDTGGNYDNFILWRRSQANTTARSVRVAIADFTKTDYVTIVATTNNSGSSIVGASYNGTGYFSKSGTTVTYSNSTNKLASGVTYSWIAW